MTFPQKWLLSRPSQWLIWQNITNWLLSRPLCFAPNLDSFQDPHVFGPKLTHFKMPCSELSETSPNWFISRPSYGLLQCFNLHGRLPAKSPWETSSIHNSSKHPAQWISDFIVKQRRKTHHIQIINTFQDPGATCSTPDTTIFIKTNSFQDPRNFTSTVDSSICLKTLSSQHRHRTKTLLLFISQICTYSLVTLSSLRAHYIP